jgi:3-methylfumaryl-CoA hydratase
MLLTNLLRMHVPNAQIERFVFRARRPIFDTSPFVCVGHPHEENPALVELSTRGARGDICMSATATIRERTASAA